MQGERSGGVKGDDLASCRSREHRYWRGLEAHPSVMMVSWNQWTHSRAVVDPPTARNRSHNGHEACSPSLARKRGSAKEPLTRGRGRMRRVGKMVWHFATRCGKNNSHVDDRSSFVSRCALTYLDDQVTAPETLPEHRFSLQQSTSMLF